MFKKKNNEHIFMIHILTFHLPLISILRKIHIQMREKHFRKLKKIYKKGL